MLVASAETDTVTLAAWLSEPETPVNVTVEVLAAADAAANRTTVWGVPGVILKLAGLAVTPGGKPLNCTEI